LNRNNSASYQDLKDTRVELCLTPEDEMYFYQKRWNDLLRRIFNKIVWESFKEVITVKNYKGN